MGKRGDGYGSEFQLHRYLSTGRALDHTLLTGPSGVGKSSIVHLIANSAPRSTSPPRSPASTWMLLADGFDDMVMRMLNCCEIRAKGSSNN